MGSGEVAKNPDYEVTSGREGVLAAAESCLQRFGLAKTTIEDVAQASGLSRATVYRQFGNRDRLLLAVAARDAERTAADADVSNKRPSHQSRNAHFSSAYFTGTDRADKRRSPPPGTGFPFNRGL